MRGQRGDGAAVAPADTKVYVGPESQESGWLEFRTAYGISVVIERVATGGGNFSVIR